MKKEHALLIDSLINLHHAYQFIFKRLELINSMDSVTIFILFTLILICNNIPLTNSCSLIFQIIQSSTMVENNKEYVLQWPGHAAYVSERFSGLLARQTLVDITLICEEQKLRVHKLVLASCSLYFEVWHIPLHHNIPCLSILHN